MNYLNIKSIIFQLFSSILKIIFFNCFKFHLDITIFFYFPFSFSTPSRISCCFEFISLLKLKTLGSISFLQASRGFKLFFVPRHNGLLWSDNFPKPFDVKITRCKRKKIVFCPFPLRPFLRRAYEKRIFRGLVWRRWRRALSETPVEETRGVTGDAVLMILNAIVESKFLRHPRTGNGPWFGSNGVRVPRKVNIDGY